MDAIPEGLARTAGLITSAAAIMIVVFAAFTFGNFLVVKMIGFTLAVAVFIDATLVRIVIGPALLRIAGDWNWWPGGSPRHAGHPWQRAANNVCVIRGSTNSAVAVLVSRKSKN